MQGAREIPPPYRREESEIVILKSWSAKKSSNFVNSLGGGLDKPSSEEFTQNIAFYLKK